MSLIIKKLGSNSTPNQDARKLSEYKEVMVGITSVIKDKLPGGAQVLAESKIPAFCIVGNLIFEKKYHEAIELGNKLLEQTPYSAGVHVNLMDAYFRIRNEDPHFFDKCLEHARLAMLYGHNTGYVQERLVISLEKQGKIYQAMQICDIVLLDKFKFSSHGCGKKDEFLKRKEKLQNKLEKALDNDGDFVFTNDEISEIIERLHE
jgi:tetratricopeptide (TPR) repeat protein